jgi:hypothetical protein
LSAFGVIHHSFQCQFYSFHKPGKLFLPAGMYCLLL